MYVGTKTTWEWDRLDDLAIEQGRKGKGSWEEMCLLLIFYLGEAREGDIYACMGWNNRN